MPPKKKPDKKKDAEEEPPGYNFAIMNLDQLKQYARLLEGEIEDMRKHCNFYQKMEDELVELLRITEDDLKCREDNILTKEVELEKLKLKFIKHIREKRQCPEYMECSVSMKAEKLSDETCSRLEQEEIRHLQETKRLKQILQEKDRKLEALRVKLEMARKETQENNEEFLKVMDDHQQSLLEQAIRQFEIATEEAQKDFMEAKKVMELEARESKISGERTFNNACESFKQKLHDYYKEVTRQDLDTIKRLKQQIKKVQENTESSKLLLKESQEQNKLLKDSSQTRFPSFGYCNKFNAEPWIFAEALKNHNKAEKLTLENQNLEKQIKDVMDQTFNLRRQFTSALKKVHDSAEMKAAILERKLNFILEENQNKSASAVADSEMTHEDSSEFETSSEYV